MRVRIYGPNLRDQSKGTFVVHAVGCKDNEKLRHEQEVIDYSDAETRREIVEFVYPPDQFTESSYQEYREDIHFAPCVTIPEEGVGS